MKGYDEPEIIRSQLSRFCPVSVDAGQAQSVLFPAWYNSGMSADEAFLRHLLSGIVFQPEHIRLVRSVDARGILFRVSLAKSDMPLLIGKAGQSIHAVRE